MSDSLVISGLQTVPLSPVDSQTLQVTLNGQVCQINVYVRPVSVPVAPPGAIITEPPVYELCQPIYLDLFVNDAPIILGTICLNGVRLVRDSYLGFIGDLVFYDTQGVEDPLVAGLGSRWLLTYWPFLTNDV